MNGYSAAIIWDLDGTLIDSAVDLAQALNTMLREHGYAGLDEDHVRTMIGDGVQKLIERGFKAAGVAMRGIQLQDVMARFMLIYSACATNKTRLYPGARSVLQDFSDAGVRQGICTNKPESITKQILSSFSIARHFDIVVGGDTTVAKKPDPLPLQSCLEALNVMPRESIMIGDSAVDVATAQAMNMPVGIVSYGYARSAARTLGADFLIDKLSSLPATIGELREARQ
jgi:phosphoglycolate phosphatase